MFDRRALMRPIGMRATPRRGASSIERLARIAVCSRSRENIDRALIGLAGGIGVAADAVAGRRNDRPGGAQPGTGRYSCQFRRRSSKNAAGGIDSGGLAEGVRRQGFSYINAIDPLLKRMAKRGAGVVVSVIGAGGRVASPTHLVGGSANAAPMLGTAGLGAAYAGVGVGVVGVSAA
jgi:hypothetical protein